PIQRFNVSFDHSLTRFTNDTSRTLATTGPLILALPNGQTVNLGLVFNTPVGQPCVTPILNGAASPLCNGILAFRQFTPIRSAIPNDEVSFQGNWRSLDSAGRVKCSGGHVDRPDYLETFSGETTRTQQARYAVTGATKNRRVAVSGDYGVTVHVRGNLRLVDDFRWIAFRISGGWNLTSNSLFSTSLTEPPNVLSSGACPPPDFKASGCPQHTAASGPDVLNQVFDTFLGHDSKI